MGFGAPKIMPFFANKELNMLPACTKFHTLLTITLSLLIVLLSPLHLSAQFDTASVLGTIRDESGAVLAGATVTLTNQATGISATAQTDENGSYEFLTVKIGTYKIEASLASFSTRASRERARCCRRASESGSHDESRRNDDHD